MSQDSAGRYYNAPEGRTAFALVSAARTATGTGTAFPLDDVSALHGFLTITAVAGTDTPTLTVSLETSVDGTNWYPAGAFTAKTATGSDARAFGPLGTSARWAWTVSGTTPSFTFALTTSANRDD